MDFQMEVKGNYKKVKENGQKSLTMEDALAIIGGFSKFQICMILFFTFVDYPNAMSEMNPILTGTAQVKWTCQQTDEGQIDIPEDDLCSFACNGQIIRSGKEPYRSIVQEWNLTCSKSWIPDAILSLYPFGRILAKLGLHIVPTGLNEKTFYTTIFFLGISGFLSAVSTGPIFFALSRFLSGVVQGVLGSHIPKAVLYTIFTALAILSSIIGFSVPEMSSKPLFVDG